MPARASSAPARRCPEKRPVVSRGVSFEVVTPLALPVLEPLVRAYYEEAGVLFGPAQQRALAMLAVGDAPGRAWLMRDGGEAVGYIVATFGFAVQQGGRDAFIDEIYVAPSHRGRGVGRAALAQAEEFLRESDVRAIHLAIKPELPRAQTLYRRHGFVDHGWRMMSKELA